MPDPGMHHLTRQAARILWESALEYLDERAEPTHVRRHLDSWEQRRVTTLSGLYRRLLGSLRNRQAMPNAINEVEDFREVLFGFSPKKTARYYGTEWRHLFRDIRSTIRCKSRMRIRNPRSYWVQYTKGVLSGAHYLSLFGSGRRFVEYADRIAGDPAISASLPLLLSREVYGLGFPLACDFLKDAGWFQYPKPDVHTKAILRGVGFSDGSDYMTYKAILTIADSVSEKPFSVDKALWLIGSGKLHLTGERFTTKRADFIRVARRALRTLSADAKMRRHGATRGRY